MRAAGRANADGVKKARARDRAAKAVPAPEANAEIQANLDVCQTNCAFNCSIVILFLLSSKHVSLQYAKHLTLSFFVVLIKTFVYN